MTQADQSAPQAGAEGQPDPAAPWGDDENFDPDKAKKLIANLKGENTKLKNREVLTDEHKAQLAEFEKIRTANQTELEKVQGDLTRWQTEAERWRTAAVASKVEALAAADFEYPDLAVGKLDLGAYLDAGGQINEAAIRTDLQKVLTDYPKLGRAPDAPAGPRAPAPNPAQGTSGAGAPSNDPATLFAASLQQAISR